MEFRHVVAVIVGGTMMAIGFGTAVVAMPPVSFLALPTLVAGTLIAGYGLEPVLEDHFKETTAC